MKLLPKLTQSALHLLLLALFFLFPIFFLTNTANFFETNKLMLLFVVTFISLFLWGIKLISQKSLRLTITPLSLPLVLIIVSTLLSTFLSSANPVESLLGRGGLYISLSLLALVASNNLRSQKIIHQALYAFISGATLLSFVGIFQSLGFGLSSIINKVFSTTIPDTLGFSPAGSPLSFLSYVTPILIIALILAFYKEELMEKVTLFVFSAVMATALILNLFYSFPGKDTSPVLLPLKSGYIIAIETLKNPKTAILGYGPEQFINAFNKTRPIDLNLTNFWSVRFTSSTNEILQIITTTGLIGLAIWAYLLITVLKLSKTELPTIEERVIKFSLLIYFFLYFLIPGTYPLIANTFFMVLLLSIALIANKSELTNDLRIRLHSITKVNSNEPIEPSQTPILPIIAGVPLVIISLIGLYFSSQVYSAEVVFKKSLEAAIKNDGNLTYELQKQAINKNPYITKYRRAYSATNLALANSISANGNLSDQDKQNVTQLIQQSIRESKAAVTLDPQNTTNWESLILIYRNLIGVAQGADQWTIASYAQAVQNDPLNPRLRLELGGIYYALGQYDQSIRLFQQAAELKPDWANSYYNLSAAHRQKKELVVAYNYMRQVVNLVNPDTADYTKAQQELTDLAKAAGIQPDQTNAPQTNLTEPEATPTPNPQNQVELPETTGPADATTNEVTPPTEPTPTPAE